MKIFLAILGVSLIGTCLMKLIEYCVGADVLFFTCVIITLIVGKIILFKQLIKHFKK